MLDDIAHNNNQHCGATGSLENDPNFAALNRGVVCKQKTGTTWYPFTNMHRSFSKEGTPQHFCSSLYIFWANYKEVSRGHPTQMEGFVRESPSKSLWFRFRNYTNLPRTYSNKTLKFDHKTSLRCPSHCSLSYHTLKLPFKITGKKGNVTSRMAKWYSGGATWMVAFVRITGWWPPAIFLDLPDIAVIVMASLVAWKAASWHH